MSKTVVYDFDGTLAYGDSLERLFNGRMRGWRVGYRLYYYFLKVLSKLKLSTVKREKERMIRLLFHSDERAFLEACERQTEGYNMTAVIAKLNVDVSCGNRVIVLSASTEYFLKKLFEGINVEVMGTTFDCKDGKIMGIKRHPFHLEKVETLRENGIEMVDEIYFDSKWDDCLKKMSRRWYKVKEGEVIEQGGEM